MQRLDKILSDAKAASRRELRSYIQSGRVAVNGVVIRKPETKFDESSVTVTLDGRQIETKRTVVLMLHKPAGYVTSTREGNSPTVMELLPERYQKLGVLPVGRLDKETEGLLLFTNDGELHHRLISPGSCVWKTYYAEHEGTATQQDVEAFRRGLTLADGTVCFPAVLEPISPGKSRVKVQEGKYHQVRRMLASRQMHVTYLRRIAVGKLTLDDLKMGDIREISAEEAKRSTGLL